MSSVSAQKRQLILDHARTVFVQKGYTAVTMQDIIDACNISRGGIYLYFSSVEALYKEVIFQHNEEKLTESQHYLQSGVSFTEALDDFFVRQKSRLLHMEDSLIMSMYEFRFAHKESLETEFFRQQFRSVRKAIWEILDFGVAQGELSPCNTEELASHVVFFIEGISMLGTAVGLSEEEIDRQLALLRSQILAS